jgi:release factor glutamine methyltransferase
MRLEISGDGTVLFPTDVGVSLLAALNHDAVVTVTGKRVLDIGCGSGLYTVAMLLAGAARVSALDVNPACVRAAVENVARNGLNVDQVESLPVDLATVAVDQPWDVLVCNPPHFPYDPLYASDDGVQAALVGGVDGRAVYDVLLARLDELLAPDGVLVLAHSSLTDIPRTRAALTAAGYRCRTVQVCELDIPLRRFAEHRDVLLAHLYELRNQNRARFTGLRFEVHTLAITRASDEHRGVG